MSPCVCCSFKEGYLDKSGEIEESTLVVGVLGLGRVGLPTALTFAELGWSVVGADHDREKVERIASGKAPFYEPGLEEMLSRQLESGRFRVTANVGEAIRKSDVIFICVGTPLRPDGSVDLSEVEGVVRTVAENLNSYKLIVEKSTVPVLTAEWIKRTLRRWQRTDNEFDVASNPEFLREGMALEDCLHPHRIVLGVDTKHAEDTLLRLYKPLVERGLSPERILITDPHTAELIKHAANAFLALKISYINFISDICEAVGANVLEVARGIGLDPRIGLHFLQAGIGFGGFCLPKDLRAFIRMAKELGIDASLLEAAEKINEIRSNRFLNKVRHALWVLKGKRLAVWGLSFKPNTDDIREAPSIPIVRKLLEEGAVVSLYDPAAMPSFSHLFPPSEDIYYAQDIYDAVQGAHALLLLTEWEQFYAADWEEVRRRMALHIIVDGRNALDYQKLRDLGFEYYGMGVR